jgi:hypothetical protein
MRCGLQVCVWHVRKQQVTASHSCWLAGRAPWCFSVAWVFKESRQVQHSSASCVHNSTSLLSLLLLSSLAAAVRVQAWGVLEQRTGNAALARELFKAALKVDPKNESTWSTWITMEEDLGRLEAANELRIRRSEQQWEFVIPASFSTRPAGAAELAGNASDGSSSASGTAAGLVQSLLGTLNRFFSARGAAVPGGAAAAGGSISSSSSSSGSSSSGARQQQLMRELLPSDFRADLTLEDIISEASALEVGASNGSSSSSSRAGSTSSQNGSSSSSSSGGQQPAGQVTDSAAAEAAAAAPAAAGGVSSSSTGSWDSSIGRSRSRELFRRQRQQQRSEQEMGLQQRPTRPAAAGKQQSQ